MELIGEYVGSGFKETPYLARRIDGQVLQLTRLLYLVAEAVDGERDFGRIAEKVTEKFGRVVSADNIKFLVEKKLRPLGVLTAADGTSPKLKKAAPMLSLKFRTRLVPERVVRAITTLFHPLFYWPIVLLVLGSLGALDAWLFFDHGVAQSAREIVYQPALFLMVFGLIVLSAAFHECGHATACRFGGAKPGVLGAGLYLVYPAFFSDVTDVYRLGKWGRVRTDLGGIYFNMIFSLLTAGAYFLTGFEPLLAIIVLQHFEMLHQLLPFLRLDGYYVVSDITGVPDLFARIKPILLSLLPWRESGPAVTALKPWVRVVVTAWVLSVVPILLYLLATLFVAVPRLLATAWDSLLVQYDNATSAFSDGEFLAVAAGAIQMIFLVLPLAGLAYTFGLIGKRLGVAAWARTEGNPVLRTGLASAALVSFGLLTFAWWPTEPIQPGERGTVQDSLQTIGGTVQDSLKTIEKNILTLRPGLAAEQEEESEDAPALKRLVSLLNGTDASETNASETDADKTGASENGAGEPVRRTDKPAPAEEEKPPDAQKGEQEAAPQGEVPGGEQDDAQPPSQPADEGSGNDYDRGGGDSGYGGDSGGDSGYYSGGGSYDSGGGGSSYDRGGSYDSDGGRYDSGGSRSSYNSGSSYDSGGDSRYDSGGSYSGGDSGYASGGSYDSGDSSYDGGDSSYDSGGGYGGGDRSYDSGGRLTCDDFRTEAEATAAIPSNPHLDTDGNGRACESLP